MELLKEPIGLQWIVFTIILSAALVSLCVQTWVFQRLGIRCGILVKTDRALLKVVKWGVVIQVVITLIGSFFFFYLFRQLVENFIIAGILFLAVMISERILNRMTGEKRNEYTI